MSIIFIKNYKSINQKTIKVNDDIREYLSSFGYEALSFDKNSNLWIFINNTKISSLINKYKKGGDIKNEK